MARTRSGRIMLSTSPRGLGRKWRYYFRFLDFEAVFWLLNWNYLRDRQRCKRTQFLQGVLYDPQNSNFLIFSFCPRPVKISDSVKGAISLLHDNQFQFNGGSLETPPAPTTQTSKAPMEVDFEVQGQTLYVFVPKTFWSEE